MSATHTGVKSYLVTHRAGSTTVGNHNLVTSDVYQKQSCMIKLDHINGDHKCMA